MVLVISAQDAVDAEKRLLLLAVPLDGLTMKFTDQLGLFLFWMALTLRFVKVYRGLMIHSSGQWIYLRMLVFSYLTDVVRFEDFYEVLELYVRLSVPTT